ncbi:MAG TPA: signal peptidase I [Chloroflexota bacterium]|jgi:signal peptidase I|nr:signal peptidase I [Chloroflexota bacterium]
MDQDAVALDLSVARAPRFGWLRKFGLELLQTVAIMAVLLLGIRGVLQNFRVEGPSMQPTLSTGEFLWVNKAAYFEWDGQFLLGGPQRGDIAVLRPPDTTEDIDLIKRVIGLPGDRVRVQHGEVYINGHVLSEPYIRLQANYTYPVEGGEVTVPAGQYFVLGDNRANSRDSHFGWFVPAENLVGRAWLSYWPPAAWGMMPGVAYAEP